MSDFCEKLPVKLELKLFGYDLEAYKERLYQIFKRDFIDNEVIFEGKRVDIIHQKFFENKERSFWHIISSGEEDANRTIDASRCASLPYAKSLIVEDGSCTKYKKWVKYHDKTKRDRYYIWCTEVNYMVILEDRGKYYKLITAYNVEEYNVRRYEKDYRKYMETKTSTD